jgi:acyl carrier protein
MSKKLYIAVNVQDGFVKRSSWAKTTADNIMHYLKSAKEQEDTYQILALCTDCGEGNTNLYSNLDDIKSVRIFTAGLVSPSLLRTINDKLLTDPDAADVKEIIFVGIGTSKEILGNAMLLRSGLPGSINISVSKNLCSDVSEDLHKYALSIMENCDIATPTTIGVCEDCVEEEVFNLIKSIPNINTKLPMLYTSRLYEDLLLDSLDYSEITLTLEEKFAIAFSEEELESMRTIGDLIDTVNKLRKTTTIHYGTI